METQLPHLKNPHKIKKIRQDETEIQNLIWGTLALIGSSLFGGSLWLWLAGLWLGKYIVRLLFAITLAIVVYILTSYSSLGEFFGYSFLKQTDI